MPVQQRFTTSANFLPSAGAACFQMSSPSILDISAVTASLMVFEEAGMQAIVEKSAKMTGYLERLLDGLENPGRSEWPLWSIVTPRHPDHRGAMLGLRWHQPEYLERVAGHLKARGIIIDVRKPDLMRVTPVALYNTFEDVHSFVWELGKAVAVEL